MKELPDGKEDSDLRSVAKTNDQHERGDCVLITTCLINKIPMKILDWKTPFGMLHGVLPSYDQLIVISCLCFATITKPHKDKFSPISINSVLIGYPPRQKEYKLDSLETHEVFCIIDVVFLSIIFPLKKDSSAIGSSLPTQHWPHHMGVQDDENFPCYLPNRTAKTVMPNIPEHNGTTPVVQETSTSICTNQVPPTRRMATADTSTTKHPTYPLFQTQDFEQYLDDYISFLANVLAIPKHVFYSQAVTNPKWVEAMTKELLEANDTWTHTDLRNGHKAISSK
nr:hypothetical protein [Tanacetum cinerariifolium]